MKTFHAPEKLAGLALVAGLHLAALLALWQHRLLPVADTGTPLFVNFLTSPPAPQPAPTPAKAVLQRPKARSKAAPQRERLLTAAAEAPGYGLPPSPSPAPEADAPRGPAKAQGPLMLGGELSLACPERTPPRYPAQSRRLGEEGKVVLRVELDEQGLVAAATVSQGSGFPRLDEAALSAVRSWRCQPAQRHGQPLRAVAVQPFNFVLQGS